jgi:hypothetical protein
VADAAGRTAFVANASGGIDAVDLASGDLLWSAAGAKRPLLAADDRLFAWTRAGADGFRVVVFDVTQKGKRTVESEKITLPEGMTVDEGPGRSFVTAARLDKGRLVVEWEARMDGPPLQKGAGLARIDLDTGKVETTAAERRLAPDPPALPKELEKAEVRWRGAAGDAAAALVLDDADGRQTLRLWKWDPASGKTEAPKDLLTGRRPRAMPTMDDRNLCVRDCAGGAEAGADGLRGCDWSIYSVESGERVARGPHEPGTQGVAIVGQHALYLVAAPPRSLIDKPVAQPRTLKCVLLRTGKVVWERPVEAKPAAQ